MQKSRFATNFFFAVLLGCESLQDLRKLTNLSPSLQDDIDMSPDVAGRVTRIPRPVLAPSASRATGAVRAGKTSTTKSVLASKTPLPVLKVHNASPFPCGLSCRRGLKLFQVLVSVCVWASGASNY